MLRDPLERRHRQRHRSACLDQSPAYWPQGPDVEPKEAAVPATLDWDVWLGGSEMRPFSPAYAAAQLARVPGLRLRRDRRHGVPHPGHAEHGAAATAPISVECVKQEGKGKYTFPKKTVLRFDFPARGTMPPVRVFWHDGLNKQPEIQGVPAGELLGDRDINGSLFIGEKGMVTTGCYGERTRLVPAAKMKDYKLPPPMLHALARATIATGSAPQGRRAVVLELQRLRPVRAVDAARGDRDAVRRQADVGRGEDAVHEQRGSERVPEAEVPQGLEVCLSLRGKTQLRPALSLLTTVSTVALAVLYSPHRIVGFGRCQSH